MKTLLAAPIHKVKEYTEKNWIAHLKIIADWYGLDVVFCDNTQDDGKHAEYIRSICPENWIVLEYTPKKDEPTQSTITASQNILRDYFLKHKQYDFLLFIEEDIYPPTNFLDRVEIERKRLNADVYNGLYFIYQGHKSTPMIQSLFVMRDKDGRLMDATTIKYEFVDIIRYYDLSQDKDLIGSDPSKVYAAGFGCSLIGRAVLEKIKFRHGGSKDAHSDSFFYEDCAFGGFSVYVDPQIICKHDNFDWKQ